MELTFENYSQLKAEGLKRAEIAQKFEIPDWKLKKHIASYGWGKKAPSIKNADAFDDYTEQSCYWAGFIAADGNVDTKGRIRIMLKYDDMNHLVKFRDFLKSDHAISTNTTKYNRCSFEFTDINMCEILELNYNIVPNKTDKYKLPNIPFEYMRHFIRGYFDGDGSICESFSNKNSITASLYATVASGSKQFAEALFEYLSLNLGTGGHLQKFTDSNKYQLKFNTNDAITLLSWMYGSCSTFLDRKYKLYQTIVVENIREIKV